MYPKQLQMAVLVVTEDSCEVEYPVRVLDVLKRNIEIDAPLDDNNFPKRVPAGTPVQLKYVMGNGLYHFETHAVRHVQEKDQVPTLMIEKPDPEKIVRVQRRAYFRVPVMLEATVEPEAEGGTRYKVQLVELSGGGFSFRLGQQVAAEGEKLSGTLVLPLGPHQEAKVLFRGVVRRAELLERMKEWHCGVEFELIADADRETVMQYCFERQRQMRRMGLLTAERRG